jgi:hypothetical protein
MYQPSLGPKNKTFEWFQFYFWIHQDIQHFCHSTLTHLTCSLTLRWGSWSGVCLHIDWVYTEWNSAVWSENTKFWQSCKFSQVFQTLCKLELDSVNMESHSILISQHGLLDCINSVEAWPNKPMRLRTIKLNQGTFSWAQINQKQITFSPSIQQNYYRVNWVSADCQIPLNIMAKSTLHFKNLKI